MVRIDHLLSLRCQMHFESCWRSIDSEKIGRVGCGVSKTVVFQEASSFFQTVASVFVMASLGFSIFCLCVLMIFFPYCPCMNSNTWSVLQKENWASSAKNTGQHQHLHQAQNSA